MKVFLIYFSLVYKKSLKVLLKSALSVVLALVLLGFGIFGLSYMVFKMQAINTVNVGVVISQEQTQAKLVARFIQAMDSVKSICSFSYLTEEKAMEELHTGEIQAVISLPDSFSEDIYTGQEAFVDVWFSEEGALNVKIFKELVNDGISMLQTAQSGVFACVDLQGIYKAAMDQYEIANYISYVYIEAALDRDHVFEQLIMSPFGDMDLYQYYISAAFSVILLMSGLSFGYLYKKESRAVEQKLEICGLGPVKLSMIKVFVMTGILWMTGTAIYSIACIVCHALESTVILFDWTSLFWMILICMAVSVYFNIVYTVFGDGLTAPVFLLTVNMLMIVCSGAVIPVSYLPLAVEKISSFMPFNHLNRYCSQMLFHSARLSEAFEMVLWSVMLFLAAAAVQHGKKWRSAAAGRLKENNRSNRGRRFAGGKSNRGRRFGDSGSIGKSRSGSDRNHDWHAGQYATWYLLQQKAWLGRFSSWLALAGMVVLLSIVASIHWPKADNTAVGIYASKDAAAVQTVKNLESGDSIYEFVTYTDVDRLRADVVGGELECGFIFDDHLEQRIDSGRIRNAVTYISTPFSYKGAVAKETVYAAFLKVYSETILADGLDAIYGSHDEMMYEQLLEFNHQYLKAGGKIWLNDRSNEAEDSRNDINTAGKDDMVRPVQGIAGLLIFIMLWLECGRKFAVNGRLVYKALDMRRRNIFEYCGYLAAALIPAVSAVALIYASGLGRGLFTEAAAMAIFTAAGSLWVMLAGKLCRNQNTLMYWVLTMVIIQLFVCPVFMDLSVYVPALGVIRWIFPLYWYLAF